MNDRALITLYSFFMSCDTRMNDVEKSNSRYRTNRKKHLSCKVQL